MDAIVEFCRSSLLDDSVRSAALAMLTAACLLGLRVRNINTHHRVWTLVLLGMLTLPVWQSILPPLAIPLPYSEYWLIGLPHSPEKRPAAHTEFQATADAEPDRHRARLAADSGEGDSRSAPASIVASASETNTTAYADDTSTRNWRWLVYLYLTGVAIGLVRLCLGIWQVHQLVRAGERVFPAGKVQSRVFQSTAVCTPATVGVVRPVILLPDNWHTWPPGMLRSVLEHEQTHIDRADYLVGLLAELNRCVYWFHPVAWWLRRKLATQAEQVCDDLVIAGLSDRIHYAEHLLMIAAGMRRSSDGKIALSVPMARTTQLESRIDAILDVTRPLATRLSLNTSLLVLAGMLTATALLAVVQADDKPSSTSSAEASEPNQTLEKMLDEVPVHELSKKILVVDFLGEPIANATVTPWAILSSQGHSDWTTTGYEYSDPPTFTTNERGIATIVFARYCNPTERIRPQALTCSFVHPDYADTLHTDVVVTEDKLDQIATVTMQRGALVEVEAMVAGERLTADNLYALWGQFSHERLIEREGGRVTLPRLSAGMRLIRLLHVPEEGPILFSEIHQVNLANGDETNLTFNLEPGVTVHGQIDDSVPRPVLNGRVKGRLLDLPTAKNEIERIEGTAAKLEWFMSSTINADGSFTLTDVPPGNLQLTALCDGYRAAAAKDAPVFALPRRAEGPQVFLVDRQHTDVRLNMTPTAACRITVTGPDQKPVENVSCQFWPNVQWWQGGSQLYCHPLTSSADGLRHPERNYDSMLAEQETSPYSAWTDSNGIALVRNLPAELNRFGILHDDYELANDPAQPNMEGLRLRDVSLVAGEAADVTISLRAKGSEFLGEQVKRD
ncbi:MAG: hypothetical protein KDB23_09500 [Planctomycetales bacterium]|nr:hypothetical protein [Planctomycetales bacterium]